LLAFPCRFNPARNCCPSIHNDHLFFPSLLGALLLLRKQSVYLRKALHHGQRRRMPRQPSPRVVFAVKRNLFACKY
jgi:hypothetical protein